MDRRRSLVWCIVALAVMGLGVGTGAVAATDGAERPNCDFPVTVTDATGADVTVDSPPEQIVVLTPGDAQTVWELGARERVVGMPVGQYTSYLDGYDEPKDVSADDGVSVIPERVVDLEPDLILAGNITSRDDVTSLRRANQTVYHFRTASTIEDVTMQVLTTGQLIGECERADRTVDRMAATLEMVSTAVSDADRPLVYYAMGEGWTAGTGTFQHEIISAAGGENLGERAGIEGWGQLNGEVIVEENPEWIVYGHTFEEPPVSDAGRTTTAWETGRIVEVNAHYLAQPGPRVVETIAVLAETFHPDAFASAASHPSNGSNDTDGSTSDADGSSTDPDDESPPSIDDRQPGFGVAITIAAGLVVAWVSLHRRVEVE